jgi:hypothetical protein
LKTCKSIFAGGIFAGEYIYRYLNMVHGTLKMHVKMVVIGE